MANFLLSVVRFVVIPMIMATGLVLAILLARTTRNDGSRVAAYAGVFAGLVAGSGFAITQIAASKTRENVGIKGFEFNMLAVIIGLLVGVGLPFILLYLPQVPRIIGLITLILSGSSSLSLFNYLLSGRARDFTMLLAMSLLFGVLVWFVFNGDKVDKIKALFRSPQLGSPN